MNKIHKRRLSIILFSALSITLAVTLILYALRQNINAFMTPSDIATAQLAPNYHCRLGGMVKNNSVIHEKQQLGVQFTVTDGQHDMTVHYNGVLPDLFHEGKGVIADGHLNQNGTFIATQVLAKHDENYSPRKLSHLQGSQ